MYKSALTEIALVVRDVSLPEGHREHELQQSTILKKQTEKKRFQDTAKKR